LSASKLVTSAKSQGGRFTEMTRKNKDIKTDKAAKGLDYFAKRAF